MGESLDTGLATDVHEEPELDAFLGLWDADGVAGELSRCCVAS